MKFELDILWEDEWTVCALQIDGENEVQKYLKDLAKRRRFEYDVLMTAIERFAQRGPSPSKEKFRFEGDGVFALKASQQRAYGFFHGECCFVVAACTEKKTDKADPQILQKSRDLKQAFEKRGKAKK
jgi:hypothetical protein